MELLAGVREAVLTCGSADSKTKQTLGKSAFHVLNIVLHSDLDV